MPVTGVEQDCRISIPVDLSIAWCCRVVVGMLWCRHGGGGYVDRFTVLMGFQTVAVVISCQCGL